MEPQGSAPSLSSILLDAANERAIFAGYVMWEDGASHDLSAVRWRSAGAHTGTVRVYAADLDLVNGPPTRDDGTADQSVSHTNLAAGDVTSTFSAARTGVATGAELAIVIEVTAHTSGTCRPLYFTTNTSRNARPTITSFLASVYASVNGSPALTLVASDGAVGIFVGALPAPTASALSTVVINTDTTPDEVALAFTPTEPCWIGATELLANPAADAGFDMVFYAGTTARVTKSIDAETWFVDAQPQRFAFAFPDEALTAGTTYYVALKPTTVNSVTLYYMDVASGDLDTFAPGFGYATRTDAGAWSAVDATKILIAAVIGFVASEDGAGGGGGLLTHPGMSGGLRG